MLTGLVQTFVTMAGRSVQAMVVLRAMPNVWEDPAYGRQVDQYYGAFSGASSAAAMTGGSR